MVGVQRGIVMDFSGLGHKRTGVRLIHQCNPVLQLFLKIQLTGRVISPVSCRTFRFSISMIRINLSEGRPYQIPRRTDRHQY